MGECDITPIFRITKCCSNVVLIDGDQKASIYLAVSKLFKQKIAFAKMGVRHIYIDRDLGRLLPLFNSYLIYYSRPRLGHRPRK